MNTEPEHVVLKLPGHTRYLGLVAACTAEVCRCNPAALTDTTIYDVQLAVNEGVVNAIQHAYEGCSDGIVQVDFNLYPDRLEIEIVDWGKSFDWAGLPKPDLAQPLEHGYGLYLIQQVMDRVSYQANAVYGNRLHLTKRLRGSV